MYCSYVSDIAAVYCARVVSRSFSLTSLSRTVVYTQIQLVIRLGKDCKLHDLHRGLPAYSAYSTVMLRQVFALK